MPGVAVTVSGRPEGLQALLEVGGVVRCRVLGRVNRFVVRVEAGGEVAEAHINNTGRLAGVLEPGRSGYCLSRSGGRTRFRLVAVECPGYGRAALVDTMLQMRALEAAADMGLLPWLRGCRLGRRNVRVHGSVLDYLYNCPQGDVYVEVKSAVLRLPGDVAAYPDPASRRGRRHIAVLARLAREGHRALIVFIAGIPGAKGFTINARADPQLPRLLAEAVAAGVEARAVAMSFEPRSGTGVVVLENPSLPIHIPGRDEGRC